MKTKIINKKEFLRLIIEKHSSLTLEDTFEAKELFKIFIILLSILFLLLTGIVLFLSIELFGPLATIYISMAYFLLVPFVFSAIIIRFQEYLFISKKDLEILTEFRNTIQLYEQTAKYGAAVPDIDYLLKLRNVSLSELQKEFQSLLALLKKYLPDDLSEMDINIVKEAGMQLNEKKSFFNEPTGYNIDYL